MKLLRCSLFCLLIVASEARTYQLCELYYYLKLVGMENYKDIPLTHYVCLAWFPSRTNTKYYEVSRGIPYYGIFRLKSSDACVNGRTRSINRCGIACDYFLDDDIRDDVICLKKLVTKDLKEQWESLSRKL